MKQKVIVPSQSIALTNDYLRQKGYEVVEVVDPTAETILQTAPDASGIVMLMAPFPNSLYQQMPNLKVLARYGVGYDNIDVDFAAQNGVWVTNTPGVNATSVAESAVTDILMMAKHVNAISAAMRADDADAVGRLMGQELAGKTVGIVGYGHIGQAVAKMLSGFDVKTLLYNRTKRATDAGTYVDWDTLFSQSDFISVHLAATPKTDGSIGAREFAMMKKTAILVNLARGSIVDEPALIEALQTGEIGGAALDVFAKEPLAKDSPLFQLDNVFLTPHTASFTQQAHERMAMGASKMVDQVLSGQSPDWPVNQPIND